VRRCRREAAEPVLLLAGCWTILSLPAIGPAVHLNSPTLCLLSIRSRGSEHNPGGNQICRDCGRRPTTSLTRSPWGASGADFLPRPRDQRGVAGLFARRLYAAVTSATTSPSACSYRQHRSPASSAGSLSPTSSPRIRRRPDLMRRPRRRFFLLGLGCFIRFNYSFGSAARHRFQGHAFFLSIGLSARVRSDPRFAGRRAYRFVDAPISARSLHFGFVRLAAPDAEPVSGVAAMLVVLHVLSGHTFIGHASLAVSQKRRLRCS